MVNCPKCGAVVERPVKSWKIKQTPVALHECPTCRFKWRSKNIEGSSAYKVENLAEAKSSIKEISVEIAQYSELPIKEVKQQINSSTVPSGPS